MSRVTDLKVKIFADGADYEGIVKMSKNPLISCCAERGSPIVTLMGIRFACSAACAGVVRFCLHPGAAHSRAAIARTAPIRINLRSSPLPPGNYKRLVRRRRRSAAPR